MIPRYERRIRDRRSRLLLRAFDYRQRHLARGVWFRLRRVLTFSSQAFALSAAEAERLLAEGWPADPVGRELGPPRHVVLVSAERAARVSSARPLDVRLGAELLSAEALALVPFDSAPR